MCNGFLKGSVDKKDFVLMKRNSIIKKFDGKEIYEFIFMKRQIIVETKLFWW